jgi:hypothetical protein
MYIPCKPHKNGTLLTSVADQNNVILSYVIRRRIREDFDPYCHRNKSDLAFNRSEGTCVTKTKMVDLIYNLLPEWAPRSLIVVDRLYGGLNLVEGMVKKQVHVICTCKSNRPSFIFKNFLHKILIQMRGGRKLINPGDIISCHGYIPIPIPGREESYRYIKFSVFVSAGHSKVGKLFLSNFLSTYHDADETDTSYIKFFEKERYMLKNGMISCL